jgi:hypothetical protein
MASPSEALRLQPPSDWLGEFPLSSMVGEYFAELGPVDAWIEGHGNPDFLPSLSGLWHYQAGYRYHPDACERFPDWHDDWLAIADGGGDPSFFPEHLLLAFMRIMAMAFGSQSRCLLVWKRCHDLYQWRYRPVRGSDARRWCFSDISALSERCTYAHRQASAFDRKG